MAHTITEPTKELNVTAECDVLVCGGGIAGIAAAYGCDFADVDVGGSQKQLRRDGVKLHCKEVY